MTDLINHFTTEELKQELARRREIEYLGDRTNHLQETLDQLVSDAAELKQVIILINKRAETLVIRPGGRGY